MADITAGMVKELRERTDAPMMECKRALTEAGGDMERAEELLRLGQVARLNTLGELAAGMAHELNQPLTAVLANTQAASRLLNEDEPDLETARLAMTQAVDQARRASDVLGRRFWRMAFDSGLPPVHWIIRVDPR